jgi:serine/threonine protein kinase
MKENTLFHDRYRLLRRLGGGGFSEVWLSEDAKTGLIVALKIYAPGTGLDEDGARLFSHEFSLVFNLNHSNLLKPSYFDICELTPYLVMPFCERGSTVKLAGRISEDEAWKFLHDVASGLAYLHGQESPVIHQDIKPDNILIDGGGHYLITDFGISAKARSTLRKSVGKQTSGGTLAYMAPERFGKDNIPIKASDIWSLGATLYELLSGDVPFGEHGGLIQKSGAEIPNIRGNWSNDLKKTVEHCMQPEAWDRPTAAQIVAWTEQHARGEIIQWQKKTQETEVNTGGQVSSQSGAAPVCPHCQSRNVNRVRWNWWGGIIGAALVKEYRCSDCRRTFKPGSPVKYTSANDGASSKKRRHPFISFWLILMLLTYGISVVASWFFLIENPSGPWVNIIIHVYETLALISIVLLLIRNKTGFWLFLVSNILLTVAMSIDDLDATVPLSLYTILNSAILFGILQIKKSGTSYWRALDNSLQWKKTKWIYIIGLILIFVIFTMKLTVSTYDDYYTENEQEAPAAEYQSLSYKGLRFNYPYGWTTETEELMGGYSCSVEKEGDMSLLFQIIWYTNYSLSPEEFIKNMTEGLRIAVEGYEFESGDITGSSFKGYTAKTVSYSMSAMGETAFGKITTFAMDGKTVCIVQQADTKEKLNAEFRLMENSITFED